MSTSDLTIKTVTTTDLSEELKVEYCNGIIKIDDYCHLIQMDKYEWEVLKKFASEIGW